MEFWGVEVKNGDSYKVVPDENKLIHISQASLGVVKKDKGNEQVHLYVKVGDQKLGLGTLISEKIPQIAFDLAFEKDFELSHTGKTGSVFFTGYSLTNPGLFPRSTDENDDDDDDDDDEYDSDELMPPIPSAGGIANPEQSTKTKPTTSKQKVKIMDPKEDGKAKHKDDADIGDEDDLSSSDDESEDSEGATDEDMVTMNGEVETSDDNDNSIESEDDETPKKIGSSKKRPLETDKKTPVSDKKAKLVTPQKTDGKKVGGHTATPHPAKQAGKLPKKEETKQQTPKSGGEHSCKSCNRSFKTDEGLQSHNKAKHSAGK